MVPSPQEQIEFLRNVQRLLSEGLFVASYKFALLRALADLAVLKDDDSGQELVLGVDEIAERFIELYWRQCRPFCSTESTQGQVLRQNTGRQAAIVRAVSAVLPEYNGSLARLKHDSDEWRALVREVAGVVAGMPLWKLQRVGDEVVDFLYPNQGRGRTIHLRPGAAYCLRAFHGIIRNLIEGAWSNYVRILNRQVLGHATDVASFLFGSERSSLDAHRKILSEVQEGRCFYCRKAISGGSEVDHFVPWSRYPVDLGHNFVLAHRSCNGDKADHLAAEEHLATWCERNKMYGNELQARFDDSMLPHSASASVSIARWAYSQTAEANGLVWVREKLLEHLRPEWERLLVAG